MNGFTAAILLDSFENFPLWNIDQAPDDVRAYITAHQGDAATHWCAGANVQPNEPSDNECNQIRDAVCLRRQQLLIKKIGAQDVNAYAGNIEQCHPGMDENAIIDYLNDQGRGYLPQPPPPSSLRYNTPFRIISFLMGSEQLEMRW